MFIIKCNFCKWFEETTGFSKDLSHLKEVHVGCSTCGKPRTFRCPNCKRLAKMIRKLQ
jgi:hypothetical protein